MAAKKAPMRKPVAKKPVAKKPVAKKPVAKKPVAKKTKPKGTSSAAAFRMADEKSRKAKTPRANTGSNRRDIYGQSGFGETSSNIDNNYYNTVEKVGRSSLYNISGKRPRKNKEWMDGRETLSGSETDVIREEAIKGLGLTGAQRRYVEDMMNRVPYRPKRRTK